MVSLCWCCKVASNLCRMELARMAKRPGLQEGTPSASRHEQGSYLPIRCRQKGFLPFSNWTPAAPWVGHTKLPRCQRRFFSSGFLLLPLGFLFFFFFYPRDQRAAVGAVGAKGGGGDPSSQRQGSPHKMWRFRALSLADPSSSSVSRRAEGRAQTLSTAAPSRALRGPGERLDFY